MFLLTYLVQPIRDSPRATEVEGAYVNAWIVEPTLEEADKVATELITARLWQIQHLEDSELLAEGSYEPGDENWQYYEQALLDKAVFVYHTWPHGGDEEQTIQ